ncbi:MAG: NapC/NirT family cytochrome c [Firmicutes bacterium]|nr:NapC/NirT family cytochrome c [Bacillota bacterium]
MTLPKSLMALLTKINDTHLVIAALCLSLVLTVILLLVSRDLLRKLGITKIYRLPVPIFALLVFLVLLFFSSVSSHPVFCQACHPMRVAAKELSASSHSSVKCTACHKKSYLTAMPIQKLEQAGMIFSYLTGNYKKPITANVDNDACLTCHKDLRRGIVTRFKVMMSHREVIDADIRCTECHELVAHQNKTGKKSISLMEKCSGCHNDREASSRCQTCHLGKVWLGMEPYRTWGIAHGDNWQKIHGSRSLYLCKSCHLEKDCQRCHSTVPHPEGWAYIHGEDAKENPGDCRVCHKQEKFCMQCHRIKMPHPQTFIVVHKWEVEVSGKNVCLSCHFEKDCQRCHDQHVHKNEVIGKKK